MRWDRELSCLHCGVESKIGKSVFVTVHEHGTFIINIPQALANVRQVFHFLRFSLLCVSRANEHEHCRFAARDSQQKI